jgi:hypothetical protein
MKHIRQINSINTNTYTIVDLSNYDGVMEEHPIFGAFPNMFEISQEPLPSYIQYVSFDINELNTLRNNNAL